MIKKTNLPNKPVLIGIEGYGGSGKTTTANKLKTLLESAYVVNMDDFIVKGKIYGPAWDKGAFDRKRLEKEVLIPATSNQKVNYHELVWSTNTLSEPKIVPDVKYLIVEGISCYHPDIAKYYNFKIWVDTPIDIAKNRGQARDKGNENEGRWDLWAKTDLEYQQKFHPEQVADFIIENL